MSNARYTMVTVASCTPSFTDEALKQVGKLAKQLREDAGAVTTGYGVIGTGNHAGCLILFQSYESLGGVDEAFSVYAKSRAYKTLTQGSELKVLLRNIIKLEQIQVKKPSLDAVAYGVVTRWRAADIMLDTMKQLTPILEDNGATFLRYGTVVTGESAGQRAIAVGYPSMAAIEKTYDALRANSLYKDFMGKIELDARNIIRFVG